METTAHSAAVSDSTPAALRPDLLARWLFAVAGMVLVMVAVGGITRLTESGLSITQWQPVTGALPPLSEAAWETEFAEYRATPEYRFEAGPAGMTMADFKFIYFWEWFHRLLGRLLGIAFALPLAWFWVKGMIPQGYKPRLVALLALGGLQGAFGWFMVRSGLSGEMTDVSHFWLSIHLLTALFTLAGLLWTAFDLLGKARDKDTQPARLTAFTTGIALVLFVQLLLGAWVAGLNAGHASTSWPTMYGDRLIPEIDWARGFWWTLTHDPFLLHFLHRWWAFVTLAGLIWLAFRTKRAGVRPASVALHMTLGVQMLLGIATVVSGVALWLAVAHQLVGALLTGATAWSMHAIGRRA